MILMNRGDNDDDRRSSRSSSRKSKKRRRGDRVEAKVKGWTKYYGGEITRVNDDGTYDIKFDDGERKRGVKDSEIKSKGTILMSLIMMMIVAQVVVVEANQRSVVVVIVSKQK